MSVRLVEVPLTVWRDWPRERTFAQLAQDALGFERRIRKGVNVAQERRCYAQVCHAIESRAANLPNVSPIRVLTWQGPTALAYVVIVECLQHLPSRELARRCEDAAQAVGMVNCLRALWRGLSATVRAYSSFSPAAVASANLRLAMAWRDVRALRGQPTVPVSVRERSIGKSFYPPGVAVTEQWLLFERLTSHALTALAASVDPSTREQMAMRSLEASRFFAQAHQHGSAVVVVLSFSPRRVSVP